MSDLSQTSYFACALIVWLVLMWFWNKKIKGGCRSGKKVVPHNSLVSTYFYKHRYWKQGLVTKYFWLLCCLLWIIATYDLGMYIKIYSYSIFRVRSYKIQVCWSDCSSIESKGMYIIFSVCGDFRAVDIESLIKAKIESIQVAPKWNPKIQKGVGLKISVNWKDNVHPLNIYFN